MNVDHLYRTFWRRFWAGFVDALLFAPLTAVAGWLQRQGASPGIVAAWFVCHSAVFPVYETYMHGRFGQTIGKRLLRVKVVDLSGAPLTMLQALRREAINLPFAMWSAIGGVLLILDGGNPFDPASPVEFGPPLGLALGLFGLELLSTLGSRKRRALHDLLAGSVVIRAAASRRVGASHCHACDQPFAYRNETPTSPP